MFEEKYKTEIDALYPQVLAFLPKYKESGLLTTDLQRKLRRGYIFCALIMERLERDGFVSGYNGATARKVYLMNRKGVIQMKFFEVNDPYYALIAAENMAEAVQLYISEVAGSIEESSEIEEETKEVSREYALMKYIRTTCKDGENKDNILEFASDTRRVILMDGGLV
ncbi:DNA translocase FtsK [Peribacillus frigoritolerans]|uniref:DNA translocase FtsK n=1 Tax=Peribacillus frigoritolerans TaxID=450367 RepID=UPI0032B490BC